jgi:hypothetical protein
LLDQVAIGLPGIICAPSQDVCDLVVVPPMVAFRWAEHSRRAAGHGDQQVLAGFSAADELARLRSELTKSHGVHWNYVAHGLCACSLLDRCNGRGCAQNEGLYREFGGCGGGFATPF